MTQFIGIIRSFLNKKLSLICAVIAFTIPLKLSWTYIFLLPTIILWICLFPDEVRSTINSTKKIVAPYWLMIASFTLSAIFGLDPILSLKSLWSLFFFSFILLLFISRAEINSSITALLTGQAIAGIHSVFDSAFPSTLPGVFLGKVTESGQLGLTTMVALGVAMSSKTPLKNLSIGLAPLLLLVIAGFGESFQLPTTVKVTALILFTIIAAATFVKRFKFSELTGFLILPIFIAALLVNLKRGPWFGVTIATLILYFLLKKRTIAYATFFIICCTVFITPIQDRLLHSYDHFTISGGRQVIWEIGCELINRYPLGIGFKNSVLLRQFAPEIPPELRHFHNNLINITAESGWISIFLYLFWICSLIKIFCTFGRNNPLVTSIGCALISWQLAGLVEYNFGDSEVLLIALVLIALGSHYISEKPNQNLGTKIPLSSTPHPN